MNNQPFQQEDAVTKRVTLLGTISLLALLLLFLIVTVLSTGSLASQIRLLTEHPFAVSGDVGDVKTNLALMRIRTERLQSYNQPEDIEVVRVALEDLYLQTDELLAEIEALYLGPHEDTAALLSTYQALKDAHARFLDFSNLPTSTSTVIAAYEAEHLYPLYDQLGADASRILAYVHSTMQQVFSSAEWLSHSAAMWSLLIIAVCAFGLLRFQSIIRRMYRRLYLKNRQFDVLSETIDETFLIFENSKDQCEFVSGNAQRVLGISAEHLLENRSLVYDHIDDVTAQEIRLQLHNPEVISWEKTIAYHDSPSAPQRWLHMRLYRIGENRESKYIMTLMDRTQERLANQALEDALTSAQEANSAKKDFLSRMSHEIRTPMNAIIGMTTIAAASIADCAKVKDCLQKIGYSSKHLLMLINDVLDMSRIESNRVSINAEPFELYQFLNAFVSVVYPQATAKGLEFTEKTVGFTERTTYLGDTLRLNQILLNLTSNAIKFTPTGGKVGFEVTCLPDTSSRCWLRFVVSDTGIGMDKQGLSNLYTPFEQANASIAGEYGGTGLGMSITQNLVSLMGGHITVKSKLGEGTTFTVEIPFEYSGVNLQPIKAEVLESLNVLVVDDERDICEHTVLLLKQMNLRAQWVLSGAAALDLLVDAKARGDGFDVCFVDWKMPEMDGVETARRIRERIGPSTPIIIISAYDWSDIEAQARAAGVNAFIAKPMFQSSIYNALVNVTSGAFGAALRKPPVPAQTLGGMRLLVAEDNALNTEIVVTLLGMSGAQVESVPDGQQAVDRFLDNDPGYFDAILMDVQMPVMDGCEATRLIRASDRPDAKQIPIIATTANAFTEDVASVMAAGMDAHLGKPIDIDQLYALLTRLCTESH